jgi:hypothetical protein
VLGAGADKIGVLPPSLPLSLSLSLKVVVHAGDRALGSARDKLKAENFQGAREARLVAEEAFANSHEDEKLQLAIRLLQDIAEVEIKSLQSAGDSVIEIAREKLKGGDDIEGAVDERARAAEIFRHAEECADILLGGLHEKIRHYVTKLDALAKEHAPCKALVDSLQDQEAILQAQVMIMMMGFFFIASKLSLNPKP